MFYFISYIFDFLLQAQSSGGVIIDPYPGYDGLTFFSAAFTAVGAAFQTQGIWMQAYIIKTIQESTFGEWAPLLYIISAIGGLFSVAMGQPPKNWVWFFIGPAFFHFFLFTPTRVSGVAWRVADQPQDQAQVWRLAETGLVNNPAADYFNLAPTSTGLSGSTVLGTTVEVAMPFMLFDAVLSSTIQGLITWTGLYNQRDGSTSDTNVCNADDIEPQNNWHILSNLKWVYLNSITQAKVASPALRDLFATFFSSECGDIVKGQIDPAKFIAASKNKGDNIPDSIFKDNNLDLLSISSYSVYNYTPLRSFLRTKEVPMPREFREFLSRNSTAGFYDVLRDSGFDESVLTSIVNSDRLRCDTYFDYILRAFRWEAVQIYFQAFNTPLDGGASQPLDEKTIINNMLYGWDIKKEGGECLTTTDEQRNYMITLILVHLFRNELAIMPQFVDQRFSYSEQVVNWVRTYQRSAGSINKYGEIYTWALMVPYIQGILLYLFTMAYPLAAMLLVVPGWHKMLFTWASFFAWVKLWDIGFAVVMVIERSLWAMIGNSSNLPLISQKIVNLALGPNHVEGWNVVSSGAIKYPQFFFNNFEDGANSFANNIYVFDKALTLGANLDLDFSNGYYIYLMAALYFAVPAATGQLVLGARSGAAGMVNNMVSGVAGQGANAAQSGFQGDIIQRAKSNQSAIGQAVVAKAYRSNGFATQAIGQANLAAEQDLRAGFFDQVGKGESTIADAKMIAAQQSSQNLGVASANLSFIIGGVKQLGSSSSATRRTTGMDPSATEQGGIPPTGGPGGVGKSSQGIGKSKGSSSLSGEAGSRSVGASAVGASSQGAGDLGGGTASGGNGGDIPSLRGQASTLYSSGSGAVAGEAMEVATGISGKAKGVLNYITGSEAINAVTTAGNAGIIGEGRAGVVEGNAIRQQMGIAGFKSSQYGSGYRAHSQRLQQTAAFDAAQARYTVLRDYANDMGGAATVFGGFTGIMDPGPKPEDMMGMAMKGMLGKEAEASSFFFDSQKGAFFGKVNQASDTLNQQYGYDSVKGAYQVMGATDALKYAVGKTYDNMANAVSMVDNSGYRQDQSIK